MKVSEADIEKALHESGNFSDVEKAFEKVQMITHCSTGCGGCHDKVLDVLSEMMA
jgi:NAD(P)H-nitrite reductase large subunit